MFLDEDLKVTNLGVEHDGHFVITKLKLLYFAKGEEISRVVWHYHYTGWPDFGIPDDTCDIRRFLEKLPKLREFENSPVIVHCSAGCGRAGTVCAIYRHLQTGEPIPTTVRALRECRCSMVKTKDQYKYIYKVVGDAICAGTSFSDTN